MSNTTHNSEELTELFNSLPVVDESRPDLRVINFDILNSIVQKAALHASMASFKEAKSIVREVLSKSSISL